MNPDIRQHIAEMELMKVTVWDLTNTPGGRELMGGMSWGEHADQEQKRQDTYFLQMTDAEWSAHLRTDRSQSVEEVARLRKMRANPVVEVAVPFPEQQKTPAYWYNEYLNFPHLYFSSEEEQKQAIAQVMEDWSVGVGRWRLAAMENSAVKIQRWWAQKLRASWSQKMVAQAREATEYEVCHGCGYDSWLVNDLCVRCRDSDPLYVPQERPLVDCSCGWEYAVEDGLCVDCLELRDLHESRRNNPFLQ